MGDVKGKRLEVVGGKNVPPPPPPMGLAKKPPLVASKDVAAVASLAGGVKLPSGTILPAVGFGTYKLKEKDVAAPVLTALGAGYRLIDTAQVYENEKGIGEALRKSGLGRGDVVIETKVWRSSHGYDRTIAACNQSLKKLGVDYIDLYVSIGQGAKPVGHYPKAQLVQRIGHQRCETPALGVPWRISTSRAKSRPLVSQIILYATSSSCSSHAV